MGNTVLVTGGAGYIGSHATLELLLAGMEVTVVDNLSNASLESLRRVGELAGREPRFHQIDLRDTDALARVFAEEPPDAVIHFAGMKAVGESTEIPLEYYDNNLGSTLSLLATMKRYNVRRLVFSSSATVYGEPASVPVTESFPLHTTSPYGRTKLMIEEMCRDLAAADPDWKIILLRYFNPVGAHESGRIGEDPKGSPNNLMPFVMQTAVGKREKIRVFGKDYETPDGTGVRDYIHVVDLVHGHLAALRALDQTKGCEAFNLGTGQGYSVLELIAAANRAVGRQIPFEIVARRPGDIGSCYADPRRAAEGLGWRATRGLDAMCVDSWRWQSQNPEGYRG